MSIIMICKLFQTRHSLIPLLTVVLFAVSCIQSSTDSNQDEPQPPIQLTIPTGGETYHVGDTMVIRWTANPTMVASVLLNISIDNGESWLVIPTNGRGLASTSPEQCVYKWKITPTLFSYPDPIVLAPQNTGCLVRVSEYNAPELSDESDAVFTILAP